MIAISRHKPKRLQEHLPVSSIALKHFSPRKGEDDGWHKQGQGERLRDDRRIREYEYHITALSGLTCSASSLAAELVSRKVSRQTPIAVQFTTTQPVSIHQLDHNTKFKETPKAKEHHWSPPSIIRLSLFFTAGTGLALPTLFELRTKSPSVVCERFLESCWILPTVCLTLFVVLVGQFIPADFGVESSRSKKPS